MSSIKLDSEWDYVVSEWESEVWDELPVEFVEEVTGDSVFIALSSIWT